MIANWTYFSRCIVIGNIVEFLFYKFSVILFNNVSLQEISINFADGLSSMSGAFFEGFQVQWTVPYSAVDWIGLIRPSLCPYTAVKHYSEVPLHCYNTVNFPKYSQQTPHSSPGRGICCQFKVLSMFDDSQTIAVISNLSCQRMSLA